MTDLEELKKLALAATPGEWKVCDESRENAVWHAGLTIYSEFGRVADVTPLSPYQSAAFIAAANPQTILALIRELEDMKHDLERSIATSADLATELEEARRDTERFAWTVANDDNAEAVYAMVLNHGPWHIGTIRLEIDAAMQKEG